MLLLLQTLSRYFNESVIFMSAVLKTFYNMLFDLLQSTTQKDKRNFLVTPIIKIYMFMVAVSLRPFRPWTNVL